MLDDNDLIRQNIFKIDEDENRVVFGLLHPINDVGEIDKIKDQISQKIGKGAVILSEPIDQVEYVLNKKVISYVKSHGGDLKLVSIDRMKGEVVVSMIGACALCPSAVVTMKAGIRRILSQFIPWVKRVEPAEEPKEPNFGFKLASKSDVKNA